MLVHSLFHFLEAFIINVIKGAMIKQETKNQRLRKFNIVPLISLRYSIIEDIH